MGKISIFLCVGILLSIFCSFAGADTIALIEPSANEEEYAITASTQTLEISVKLLDDKTYRTGLFLRETGGSTGFYWDTVSFSTQTIGAISLSTTPVSTPNYVPASGKYPPTGISVQPPSGDIYVLSDLSTTNATIRGHQTWISE